MTIKKSSINKFINKIGQDEIFTRSASLSFYSTFALSPLILIAISVISFLNFDTEMKLLMEVTEYLGSNAGAVLRDIIDRIRSKPDEKAATGLVSLVVLLFSSSIMFTELQTTLNKIFESTKEVDQAKATLFLFIKRKVLAILMVFSFIFIIIASIATSTYILKFAPDDTTNIARAISFFINLFLFVMIFATTFKLLPDKKVKYKHALLGGLLTTTLFIIGKNIIALYLSSSTFTSGISVIGPLAVFLTWLYYSVLILYIGAEFTYLRYIEEKD